MEAQDGRNVVRRDPVRCRGSYHTLSSGADVVGMKDPVDIAMFMRSNLGRLDAALFFDTENDPSGSTYTLMLNGSVVGPYTFRANEPWHHLALQHLVNEAIVAHRGESIDIDVTIKPIRDLQDERPALTVETRNLTTWQV